MAGPAPGDPRQGLAERAARAGVIDASKAPDLHAQDDRASETRQITQAAPVMTLDASGFGPATGAGCRGSRQSGAQGYAVVRRVDLRFFVLLCAHLRDEDVRSCYAAASTLWRRRSNPARPYMVRLMTFSRLICPSTGPVLQGSVKAACTASRS